MSLEGVRRGGRRLARGHRGRMMTTTRIGRTRVRASFWSVKRKQRREQQQPPRLSLRLALARTRLGPLSVSEDPCTLASSADRQGESSKRAWSSKAEYLLVIVRPSREVGRVTGSQEA